MNEARSITQPASDQRTEETYAWFMAASLGLIYLINMGFPMYGGSVANTYMSEALGMSKSSLGAGFSLFTLFQGLSGIVVLFSIRRLGVKPTILLGSVLLLIGSLFMRFGVTASWQYTVVYGGIMGLGVGFGTVLPITTSITLWFDRRRALAMSLVLAFGGIGGLVAAPLIDRIITHTERGWQAGWESVTFAAAISCLIAILFVREKPKNTPEESPAGSFSDAEGTQAGAGIARSSTVYRTTRDWKTVDALRSPTMWLFAMGSLGFVTPFMVCVAHSALHLRDLGITPSVASLALGLLTAFGIVGKLVAGFLGDRIEPRLLWSVSLFLLAVGCLVIIQAKTIPMVVSYAVLVGLGFGGAYVCRTIAIGNYFGASAYASINGILGAALTVLTAAAPWIGGMVRDATGSYALAFKGIAILPLLGGLCLLAVKESR